MLKKWYFLRFLWTKERIYMLYLIPTPINEQGLQTLPAQVVDIVRHLDIFLVERARSARRFIQSCKPVKPIGELTIAEFEQDGSLGPAEEILRHALASNRDVGILSEAGCPGIADPGAAAVSWAHRAGMPVTPLVGPSSILLALMASGCNGQAFCFHGYLSPKKPALGKDLRKLEQTMRQLGSTQLFMETPYRSQMVVDTALEVLQPDTTFGMAKNLTCAEQHIVVLPIRTWRTRAALTLDKAPAIFMIGNQTL
jgi:16S rRNA (cytidine1402-2'-O)-methyltransferase